ncbi:FRG domain-containing protein [Bacillus sp. Marseille-P3661]|uniref:FRG domain-containing protein n=1 Tax=Bacillus sp. Marseille-P3661 TaxID=1936234 RepID=UPI000C83E58B|nr:FRG domain-containing protein [Bacillus sp. Marseille-P3661]
MNNPLDITNYFFSKKWLTIMDEVTFFTKKSRLVWYRGQNNNGCEGNRFPLLSGLFRQNLSVDKILEWEEISYKRFFENGYELHKTENQWDLLYLMQQYGVKTRLLDWSESFAVALYFATKDWDEVYPCSVWLIDPFQLNKLFHNIDELKSMPKDGSFIEQRPNFHMSMALSPTMNTYRSMFQKGFFTLQGNTKLGLEEENDQILFNEKVLKHIQITPDLKNDIIMFLELSGINHFTLFPDLGGLANYVNHWTTADLNKQKNYHENILNDAKLIRSTEIGERSWSEDESMYS